MISVINRVIYRPTWLIIVTLFIGGCRDVVVAPPPPTPIPLRVAYSPVLRPWVDSLASCAQNQPQAAIFFEELPADQLNLNQYDAMLRFASESNVGEHAFVLGYDDLVIIVNNLNPVTSINNIEVRGLLEGSLGTWETLSPPNAIYLVSVQPFIYMPGSDLSWPAVFGDKPEFKAAQRARLVNDPGQVIDGVIEEEGGVGIVPSSWLVANLPGLKTIDGPIKSKVPIIAITRSEPNGALRELLGCAGKL